MISALKCLLFCGTQWNVLVNLQASAKTEFTEIPKYPTVRRDLALILDRESASVRGIIARKEGKNLFAGSYLFDIYEGEKLKGKKSVAIGLIFRRR